MEEEFREEIKSEKIHDKLIYAAYSEIWEKNRKLRYPDFLDCVKDELGKLYFYAVITGNLNYQVENGGFSQWYENGYHITLSDLREFFENNFGNNKVIDKIILILEEIEEILDWSENGKESIKRLDYDYQYFFSEKLEEKVFEDLENITSKYYRINNDLIKILDIYFTNEFEKIEKF